jgi:DNA polymerase (family X)
MKNCDIAAVLERLANYRQLLDTSPFRAAAYRQVARSIRGAAEGYDLLQLPGVGESIASKITELKTTGKCLHLEEVIKSSGIPESIFELTKIPGVGVKTAYKLYTTYGVENLIELKACIDSKKISDPKLVSFFGSQEIKDRTAREVLEPIVQPILEDIRTWPEVVRAEFAGSLRRKAATVRDVDILVATENPQAVHAKFLANREKISAAGEAKSRTFVKVGEKEVQLDLMTIKPDQFGIALNYFTGDKAENIALRIRAKNKGWKVNEYGVWDAQGNRLDKPGLEDSSLYELLGLAYRKPEDRNGRLP